jgi:undecaprenyl-diphosphatase
VLVILSTALLALIATRALADLAPYRLRPMYDARIRHRSYSFPIPVTLVDWSAFPSDHATFFFALAFGLVYVARQLAVPGMLYALLWVALPRLYLGIHWASDMVVGAAIGIALVWAAFRVDWLQSALAARLVGWAETAPAVFYASAFLASFEMGVLFEDVRSTGRNLFHLLRFALPQVLVHGRLAMFGVLAVISVATCLALLRRGRTTVRIRWRPVVTR